MIKPIKVYLVKPVVFLLFLIKINFYLSEFILSIMYGFASLYYIFIKISAIKPKKNSINPVIINSDAKINNGLSAIGSL